MPEVGVEEAQEGLQGADESTSERGRIAGFA